MSLGKMMRSLPLLLTAALGLVFLTIDPAWAAEEKGFFESALWVTGWRIINFLILVVLMVKVAKDPAKAFFASKREEAEQEIRALEQAKAEAEKELADLKAKLANADEEIADIVAQLKDLAARNREKILADAKKLSEETLAQARLTADTELERAKVRLMTQSLTSIIALASDKLADRLTEADHQRLIDQALEDISSATVH